MTEVKDLGISTTKLGFVWYEASSYRLKNSTNSRLPSIKFYSDKQLREITYNSESDRDAALLSLQATLKSANIPCEKVNNTSLYINGFNVLSLSKRNTNTGTSGLRYEIVIEFTQKEFKVIASSNSTTRDTLYQELETIVKNAAGGGGSGGGAVDSVNGKTGNVVLTATDVGAYTTAQTDNKIQTATDALGNIYVKLTSSDTQVLNSNIALAKGFKLLGVKNDNNHTNLISIGDYSDGQGGTYEQIEVGTETDPLCLNHSAKSPDGVVIGKNVIVNYKDETGANKADLLAYLSDIPATKNLQTENLTSQIDGTKQIFTLSKSVSDYVLLYNGKEELEGTSFTLVGTTLTTSFDTPPKVGDYLWIRYWA